MYFKWVEFAEPLEILAHRIVWAFALLVLLVSVRGRWGTVRRLTPKGCLACHERDVGDDQLGRIYLGFAE